MNKLYNKALIYQAFYNGKWGILLGIFIFAYPVFTDINTRVYLLKDSLSAMQSNSILLSYSIYIYQLIIVLFGIYILITGFNKRKTNIFLNSGPFSRKEIKRNEIQFLFGSLLFLLVLFMYISICIYFNNKELLSFCSNYLEQVGIVIFRLFIIGTLFIVYLLLIDMLFSNTIVSGIAMYLVPVLITIDLSSIISYYSQINYLNPVSMVNETTTSMSGNYISNFISNFISNIGTFIFLNEIKFTDLITTYLPVIIIITSSIIIMMIFIWKLNKKITINQMGKFCTFSFIETASIWLIIFSIIIIFVPGISNIFIFNKNYNFLAEIIIGKEILCTFIMTIISAIISYIATKKIKKILKNNIL